MAIDSGLLTIDGRSYSCRSGHGGCCDADTKREGDGRTPLGRWPILAALLRPDRWRDPPAVLPWRWLRSDDGWCDAPGDPAYNRPVSLPYLASAERLWRDDHVYDAIVILGHNDRPPVPGRGSAIFLHLANDRPTEGCVAIGEEAMTRVLASARRGDWMTVASSPRLG